MLSGMIGRDVIEAGLIGSFTGPSSHPFARRASFG
jgi:hypothetical protein